MRALVLRPVSSPAGGLTPAAGASRALALVAAPPRFRGPPMRILASARVAIPILLTGWLAALMAQGLLVLPLVAIGFGLGLVASAGADLWMRSRIHALTASAEALVAYTARIFGDHDELTGRALRAAADLHAAARGQVDPDRATAAEAALEYTWELSLRRR